MPPHCPGASDWSASRHQETLAPAGAGDGGRHRVTSPSTKDTRPHSEHRPCGPWGHQCLGDTTSERNSQQRFCPDRTENAHSVKTITLKIYKVEIKRKLQTVVKYGCRVSGRKPGPLALRVPVWTGHLLTRLAVWARGPGWASSSGSLAGQAGTPVPGGPAASKVVWVPVLLARCPPPKSSRSVRRRLSRRPANITGVREGTQCSRVPCAPSLGRGLWSPWGAPSRHGARWEF